MVNVLHYRCDVPAKLYSTHSSSWARFLLASSDACSKCSFSTVPRPLPIFAVTFERRPLRVAAHVFWALLVGYSAFGRITGGWKAYRTYRNAQRPARLRPLRQRVRRAPELT
jgi:hypothetical protein